MLAGMTAAVGVASGFAALSAGGASVAPIRPGAVERAFSHVPGLVGPLPDLRATPPKWELMGWSFNRGGFPVAAVIAYVNSYRARQASTFDLDGVAFNGAFCSDCQTWRVENVVLLYSKPHAAFHELTSRQRIELRGDLAKLGRPTSP